MTERYSLLARVSGEEQVDGYSLDAQIRAFRSLVESRGGTIHHEWIEEGVSAHTDDVTKRPLLQEAINTALANEYEVLVGWRIASPSGERSSASSRPERHRYGPTFRCATA